MKVFGIFLLLLYRIFYLDVLDFAPVGEISPVENNISVPGITYLSNVTVVEEFKVKILGVTLRDILRVNVWTNWDLNLRIMSEQEEDMGEILIISQIEFDLNQVADMSPLRDYFLF